jgi:hypothetical protein
LRLSTLQSNGVRQRTIFALGIIGTGLLAIPVLAGSTAYAIGEGRRWSVGLSRKPERAVAFYAALAVSVLLGIGLNFTPLDPIKALYWSAVINGVLAPPVMVLLMLLVRKEGVMGKLIVEGWLYWIGYTNGGHGSFNRWNGGRRRDWVVELPNHPTGEDRREVEPLIRNEGTLMLENKANRSRPDLAA